MDRNTFFKQYTGFFNAEQIEAVKTVEGPVLLLAVPGSGKTTVLVTRLGYMFHCLDIPPEKVLTLTYTVSATADMRRRYEKVFGEGTAERIEFRTINGICQKIIMKYALMCGKQDSLFDVVEEKERLSILTKILASVMEDYPTESDVKNASTLITYAKNMMYTDKQIEELGKHEKLDILPIFKEYNRLLRVRKLMDYDDQMIYAYKMLTASEDLLSWCRQKYEYICVDEAQDTSMIQHLIISLLSGADGNLFMVGDEDQSIYGFRAAYPEALLSFKIDHPTAKILVMNKNYRSNANIVKAADRFIKHNKKRYDKHMVATRDAASKISFINILKRSDQYDGLLEVAKNCTRETAVLYRENESALPLIDRLDRKGIDFRASAGDNQSFFTNRIVVDVVGFLKLALDPYDTAAFKRVVHKCQTYIKKTQVEVACAISENSNIPIFEAVKEVSDILPHVGKNIKRVASSIAKMAKETPSKALDRIRFDLGYEDYLSDNHIDSNKLDTLEMLAVNEKTLTGFLNRLEYLQDLLKEKKSNPGCQFILSTVHSSKGLEYDKVYLMDVFDSIFPNAAIMKEHENDPDCAEFEEERRIFYVAMTRAKNDLCIFTYRNNARSCLVKELNAPQSRPKPDKTGDFDPNYNLKIGERIIERSYGRGTVVNVSRTGNGKVCRFTVVYDTGELKHYMFPKPFLTCMKLDGKK